MKVVIQDENTKSFYQGVGQWTEEREKAKIFISAATALQRCHRERLHARVVLTFPDPAYDVILPFQ